MHGRYPTTEPLRWPDSLAQATYMTTADDESRLILAAYRGAMKGTWDDVVGMRAAERTYSELHPEICDREIVTGHVTVIVYLAIIEDPASFWG